MNKTNKFSTEGFWGWLFGRDFMYRTTLDEFEKKLDKELKGKGDADERAITLHFSKSVEKVRKTLDERMTPYAKAYFKELKATGGSYKKRESKVLESVTFMNNLCKEILKSKKKDDSNLAVVRLYSRIYDLLFSNSTEKMFTAAYKQYESGIASTAIGTLTFFEYVSLIYTLETMAIVLGGVLFESGSLYIESSGDDMSFEQFDRKLMRDYPSLYSVVLKNALVVVKRYEDTKDPYGQFNKAVLAEKKGDKEASHESVALTGTLIVAAMIAGLLIAIPLAIGAVRKIIYSFGCLKVDISKSLIDQSYVISINVKKLEEDLSKLSKDSKEYKKLEKVVASQKGWVEKMVGCAKWLAEVDSKNLDEIEGLNKNDEEEIDDTVEEETDDSSSGGDSGKFDI